LDTGASVAGVIELASDDMTAAGTFEYLEPLADGYRNRQTVESTGARGQSVGDRSWESR